MTDDQIDLLKRLMAPNDRPGLHAKVKDAIAAALHEIGAQQREKLHWMGLTAQAMAEKEKLEAARDALAAACGAVAHQLEVGEASEGDRHDLAWCARTLRDALAPPAAGGDERSDA